MKKREYYVQVLKYITIILALLLAIIIVIKNDTSRRLMSLQHFWGRHSGYLNALIFIIWVYLFRIHYIIFFALFQEIYILIFLLHSLTIYLGLFLISRYICDKYRPIIPNTSSTMPKPNNMTHIIDE